MNTKTLFAVAFAALATLGTASAASGEATYDYPVAFTSSVTRAEVQAELFRAQAAGEVATGERSVVIADTGPALSRAQVRAETLEAIRVGAISRGEQSTSPTLAQLESIRLAGAKAVAMTMASL